MFVDKLVGRIQEKDSVLCVGLDLSVTEIPSSYLRGTQGLEEWGKAIIDRVKPYCVAVKLNFWFYFQYGSMGMRVFEVLVFHAKEAGLLVIADIKLGDGGKTARVAAEAVLGKTQIAPFDAVTLETSIADPGFSEYVKVANANGRGLFLVVRTSFKKPESRIENIPCVDGSPVWHRYAEMVNEAAKASPCQAFEFSNIGAVVGATRAEDAQRARQLMPRSIFLVPGFGAQGGVARDAVAGCNESGAGVIATSSSGICNAWIGREHCDPLDCVEEAACDNLSSLRMALTEAYV